MIIRFFCQLPKVYIVHIRIILINHILVCIQKFKLIDLGDIMAKNRINSKLIPGVGRHPFPAYSGNEKYIFVSYAHVDQDFVFSEIARFQYMKYNVWYDDIIEPGNEWKIDIGDHLLGSDLFIIFVTENSVKSPNCRKEFYCALKNKKNIIPFMVDDFDKLPIDDEWRKDLSEIQWIDMSKLKEVSYVHKFTQAFKKFGFDYGGIEISSDSGRELLGELDFYKGVEWKFVSIFIDGTFIDMHAERDFLIREVFPELNEWCYERHIILNPIDLRWGITDEDFANRNVVINCLRHIDKCRPFYMCLLGQKRGWVPDFDSDISLETLDTYPDIVNLQGQSVTEMGISHALLQPLKRNLGGNIMTCPPVRHAFFFFRDPEYINEIKDNQRLIYTNEDLEDGQLIRFADERMLQTKEMIIDKKHYEDYKSDDDETKINIFINDYEGHWDKEMIFPELLNNVNFEEGVFKGRLANFTCGGRPLKEVIIDQFKEALMKEFSENMSAHKSADDFVSELPVEISNYQESQNKFSIDFSVGDIHLENDYSNFNTLTTIPLVHEMMLREYIEDEDDRFCLVTGSEGYGKTTILSRLSNSLKDELSDEMNIYSRFCGISQSSYDLYSLWTSIIIEAMIRNKKTRFYSYPLNYFDLFSDFSKILNELASYGKTVIIIDGINYLDRAFDFLKMIRTLPENLKIIISIEDTQDERFKDELSKLNLEDVYPVKLDGFNSDDLKVEFINEYLHSYLKRLDYNDIETICGFKSSENPLYLKILLSELVKLNGVFGLSDKIASFGDSTKDAFEQVLERLEDNYGDLAKNILFLFEINFALTPQYIINKLMKMMGCSEYEAMMAVNSVLLELNAFVRVNENGCVFLNESLKDAIREKYG